MPRRFRWPRDSRPIVEVDGRVRIAARDAALKAEWGRIEGKQWAAAETFEDVCELSAQFCEGKLHSTPTHLGPRMPETVEIAAELANANRHGFLTDGSQPGRTQGQDGYYAQRAAVTGLASAETVERLRRLVEGTPLILNVSELATPRRSITPYRGDYSKAIVVTRDQDATVGFAELAPAWLNRARKWDEQRGGLTDEGRFEPEHPGDVTDFGYIPTRGEAERDHGIDMDGVLHVTIVDPRWGPHRTLWERLAQPDWDNPTPPPAETPMASPADYPPPPRIIPPGREDLYRRAEAAGAEVRRLTALYEAADRRAERLNQIYPAYHPVVRAADAETDRINTQVDRAEAVAERVHQERTAGLSSWIDVREDLPVCTTCDGSGQAPDRSPLPGVENSCRTCRGWGRADDGRPCPPVWSDADQRWIDPSTGRDVAPPGSSSDRSSLWWLDGVDTSKLSFSEVSDLARRAGDLRDEMQRQGDPPERIAEVDREYQRLLEAQEQARRRMTGATHTATPPTAPSPATSAGTGGGTTMSQQEVIAQLQAIQGAIETTLGATQEAQATLEQQEGHVQQVLDHGGQGADAVAQAVAAARQLFTDAGQHVGAAIQACEEAIQRASAV